MALTLATTVRNTACDAIVDLIDVGGAGTITFHTAAFAALLATLTFSTTAFGAAATGVATAAAITADSSADNPGTAAVFRIRSGAGTTLIDGTVGTSGADINFNTVTWTAGDNISMSSLTVTVPAS